MRREDNKKRIPWFLHLRFKCFLAPWICEVHTLEIIKIHQRGTKCGLNEACYFMHMENIMFYDETIDTCSEAYHAMICIPIHRNGNFSYLRIKIILGYSSKVFVTCLSLKLFKDLKIRITWNSKVYITERIVLVICVANSASSVFAFCWSYLCTISW